MTVWVLIAVISVRGIVGGHVAKYVNVYSTPTACEHDRAKMQGADGDAVWKCVRQEPKK